MVQKNIRFAIIIGLLTFLLNACKKHLNANDLPGLYISNFEDFRDTIVLNPNHTYLHKSKAKITFDSQKNIWNFDGGKITLENFDSPSGPPGVWIAEVVFVKDEIRIVYAEEEGYYYAKIRANIRR